MQTIELSRDALRELHRQRITCFQESENAILEHPETFREIKKCLMRIVIGTVDIDAYFDIARHLADLLEAMGPKTIFVRYFHENIDPCRNGAAWFFRAECQSLLEQINDLNTWRKQRRKLRLLPESTPV